MDRFSVERPVRSGDRLGSIRIFAFVKVNRAKHPVATMCRLLEVSASGHYAWRDRRPSARAEGDAALLARIEAIHAASRRTSGVPRIHGELAAEGILVGRKRVAGPMREAGFLYLAVVLDAFSRRIVGWSMADHLRTSLVLDALDMAVQQRRPEAVIHQLRKEPATPRSPKSVTLHETGATPLYEISLSRAPFISNMVPLSPVRSRRIPVADKPSVPQRSLPRCLLSGVKRT